MEEKLCIAKGCVERALAGDCFCREHYALLVRAKELLEASPPAAPDLRATLPRCEECGKVGEADDNRHSPDCSRRKTRAVIDEVLRELRPTVVTEKCGFAASGKGGELVCNRERGHDGPHYAGPVAPMPDHYAPAPHAPKRIDVDALAAHRVLVDFGDGRTELLTNDQARELSRAVRRAANK